MVTVFQVIECQNSSESVKNLYKLRTKYPRNPCFCTLLSETKVTLIFEPETSRIVGERSPLSFLLNPWSSVICREAVRFVNQSFWIIFLKTIKTQQTKRPKRAQSNNTNFPRFNVTNLPLTEINSASLEIKHLVKCVACLFPSVIHNFHSFKTFQA